MEIYLISMWETRLISLAFIWTRILDKLYYSSIEEIDKHEGDGWKARTKQQSTTFKQL